LILYPSFFIVFALFEYKYVTRYYLFRDLNCSVLNTLYIYIFNIKYVTHTHTHTEGEGEKILILYCHMHYVASDLQYNEKHYLTS